MELQQLKIEVDKLKQQIEIAEQVQQEEIKQKERVSSKPIRQDMREWRRFELTTTDRYQEIELNRILDNNPGLGLWELYVIISSLRVLPGLGLKDFAR